MTASTLAARLSVLVEDGTRQPVPVVNIQMADKITLSATCTLATSIFLSVTTSVGSDWRRGHIDGIGRSSHSSVEAPAWMDGITLLTLEGGISGR